MNEIALLSQETIDKIAAGEVVERPASVVKELVENAIDAGANAVTVEIKEGGISLIRITDNGCGIPSEQIRTAFLRHATSKIRSVDDLLTSGTLGFRGEALSSIAAVSQVELITKTAGSLTGVRYLIEGGKEQSFEEIGAPEGTTFLIRNMFYNTPARKKFLKTAVTEAGYISDLMEHLALSNPGISFKFINNRDTKLHTSGNLSLKDIVYGIFGREIASNVIPVNTHADGFHITGFIGKPVISRGNRNYENYFVNGRYVKSAIVAKAIEDAYKPFMMNHRYPFTVLSLDIDTGMVDVNVHPTKMEVRFANQTEVYERVLQAVKEGLVQKELIPEIELGKPSVTPKQVLPVTQTQVPGEIRDNRDNPTVKKAAQKTEQITETKIAAKTGTKTEPAAEKKSVQQTVQQNKEKTDLPKSFPEPFEKIRSQLVAEANSPYEVKYPERRSGMIRPVTGNISHPEENSKPVQMDLFEHTLLREENRKHHKLIGQLFDTYWLIEFDEKLFIIDQHAAHEKVLYERFMKKFQNKEHVSQHITPPIIVTLSMQEEQMLKAHQKSFTSLGFEIDPFGGKEYAISAVPADIPGIADKALFESLLDGLTDVAGQAAFDAVCDKIATMACKAAVKGNNRISVMEANALIEELLSLDNPYHCPHGRPTIVSMTKYELEKRFKRIL